MQLLRRHTSRSVLFAGFAGIAILAAACSDRSNPANPDPEGPGGPGGPLGPPSAPVNVQILTCTASRVQKSVKCGNDAETGDARGVIIPGPNHVYVDLTSSNVNYDVPTELFTFNLTVRNRIVQPLGTADTTGALAPDANGVRVFFRRPPTLVSGSGAITVENEDGTEVWIGGEDPSPYYQYNAVLEQFEVTAPREWQFKMPLTVNEFTFQLILSAAVPRPYGYVTVEGNSDVRPGFQRQLSATVWTYLGDLDSVATANANFTWFSADSTRAKVDSAGLVKGLRFGTTTVGVQLNDSVSGKLNMNVRRTRRIWAGTVSTDWNHPGNWRPAATLEPDAAGEFNVVPEAQDTAVIPSTGTPPNFPVLVENEAIGGVEVFQGSIALNAFNLTATGSVLTETPGQITSTVGRLVLAGIAQTVRGTLPRLNVTGTYSLDGNITVMQQIRVQSGRLRNQSFRIRQVPN